ncbi:MAG: tetratricopeptide repeat protein [Balneolaceae bacterium]
MNKKNVRHLLNSLKKNPNDSFSKFAIALELLKIDEVSKAKILFESVLEQDPDYLGVYYHLGKLYENSGRQNDAERLYQNGLKLAEKQHNDRTLAELKDAIENLNTELNNE